MKENREQTDGLLKINNEGMMSIKGGYTLHTVTVTSIEEEESFEDDCPDHGNGCDGDDGIHND